MTRRQGQWIAHPSGPTSAQQYAYRMRTISGIFSRTYSHTDTYTHSSIFILVRSRMECRACARAVPLCIAAVVGSAVNVKIAPRQAKQNADVMLGALTRV